MDLPSLARVSFLAILVAILFLALTTHPIALMIQSGEMRHVLAFVALPILSRAAWPGVEWRVQLAAYGALGMAIELAQAWMAIGRQAEFADWVVDVAAAAVALAMVELVAPRLDHRQPS